MSVHYGETPARRVVQTQMSLGTGNWTALQGDTAPMNNRRHVRIQVQSLAGGTVALAYANGVVTNDSSGVSSTAFTTPTHSVKGSTFVPGNTTWTEPLGDNVQIYGRLLPKAGFTPTSIKVIVTEYA